MLFKRRSGTRESDESEGVGVATRRFKRVGYGGVSFE